MNLPEEVQTALNHCIRCSFCNGVCPTTQVTGKESETARGRMVLLTALINGHTSLDAYNKDFKTLLDLCYNCKTCLAACPAGIDIPDIVYHAKLEYIKKKGQTLRSRILGGYEQTAKLSSLAPGVF